MPDSPLPSLSQTTSISANHRLPSIPSLPPIDIPRSGFHSSIDAPNANSPSAQPQESEDPLPNSAELSVSVESFTTACSSPVVSANAADASRTEVQGTPSAPPPAARSLPKSLSVDSFVREQHQQRDVNPPTHITFSESTRTVGQSKSHSRLQKFDPKVGGEQPNPLPLRPSTEQPPPLPPRNSSAPALRTLTQRVKRHSRQGTPANRSEEDMENSPCEDSEFEQGFSGGGKVIIKASQLRRRLSAPKRSGSMPISKASSHSHLHGSRARKAAVITVPSELTKINTTLTTQLASTATERSPQLRTKASAPTPLEATRRGRSFSIGTQSDDSSVKKAKPPLFLHIDTERPPQDAVLMTLVIIGSQGCGKSAFIRRAWKNSLLTEAARHSVSVSDSDGSRIIHYVTRKAYMQAHEGRDYYLTLIEISVQELEHADGALRGDVWPTGLPKIDGAFVLYDASDRSSFKHIAELLHGFYGRSIPYIVLACKSDDIPPKIPPSDALEVVKKYDGGIVELSSLDAGRDKARRCVGVLLRGVLRRRIGDVDPTVNPCSPIHHHRRSKRGRTSPLAEATSGQGTSTPTSATVTAPSQQSIDLPRQTQTPQLPLAPRLSSRSISSLAEQAAPPVTPPAILATVSPSVVNPPQSRPPFAPTSPTRARSMGDITLVAAQSKQPSEDLNEREPDLNRSKSILDLARTPNKSSESIKSLHESGQHADPEPAIPFKKDQKQGSASPWATLDELLEKLFFLSISGDDPSFISHFFLTYRRFTTPRRILLAMQKRMIELNQPSADPPLAAFAQLRICNLLEQWIQWYPTDFAVPGSAGALHALIRQILRQTHTLYYGTEFLPFLESLHTFQDLDSAWAVKAETTIDESDESDSNYESDYTFDPPPASSQPLEATERSEETVHPTTRERKSSIPLSAKTFLQNSIRAPGGSTVVSPVRDSLQRLQKASSSLLHLEADDIAKEITRRECEMYMKIEPRDWLRHTVVSGKKDPNTDRIARFNASYNDLHDWAASMILCHDKPKTRARVVEKLSEVAVKLRNMNNYSGLRAIITAITQSTYPNDEVMEIFKQKVDLHKKYLSFDILMRTAGAHQSYRLALRNTKGACIPSLEVHTSDLRRAHEGNPDYKTDDSSLIHWAKFNLIGRLVGTTTESQGQCRGPNGYNFAENPQIGQLFDVPLMDYDMQQERLGEPPDATGDIYSPPIPSMLEHSAHPRDTGVIKRLFFWS